MSGPSAQSGGVLGLPLRHPGPRSDAPEAQSGRRCIRVRSEADIIKAVRAAYESGQNVRAVGAGGSKNTCNQTPGTTLRLDRYDRILEVDGARVVVEAGITIGRLSRELAGHGLALPTVGEWAGATLGGAVATGTHGGAAAHGILASSVRTMRLITGEGRVLTFDQGTESFNHAAVSLGLLGVTSTLTLQCAEHFHLALDIGVTTLDQYLRTHPDASHVNEFYSAVWFPADSRVVTFAASRTTAPRRTKRRLTRFGPRTFLVNALAGRRQLSGFLARVLTGTTIDAVGPMLSPISYGPARRRLLQKLGRRWKAAEFAVPLARAMETISALERFMAGRRHLFVHPVGLRSTAQDTFSLSPCTGRDTFWIDIFFKDNEGLALELGDLFEGLDARCHWGKEIGLSSAHLRKQYCKWDAFTATRARLDPGNVFANEFCRCVGLGGSK